MSSSHRKIFAPSYCYSIEKNNLIIHVSIQDFLEDDDDDENAIDEATAEIFSQVNQQKNRITKLFQRQLRIPLLDLDEVIEQYQQWLVVCWLFGWD